MKAGGKMENMVSCFEVILTNYCTVMVFMCTSKAILSEEYFRY